MLKTSSLLADALADRLVEGFERSYSRTSPQHVESLGEAARLVIERLSLSDALYHSAEHTALVALVAQDILRGRRLHGSVPVDVWLHVILAALAPHHVDRSKLFVLDRFADHPLIDAERLARNIELTRFPVPDDGDHAETDTEAGLVRAADLIGQLGDPLYPRKLNALYHEFEETGVNRALGYTTPADVADRYPGFFWSKVEPYLGAAIDALNMTAEGRLWLANLYAHVCVIEHGRRAMGPHLDASPAERLGMSVLPRRHGG